MSHCSSSSKHRVRLLSVLTLSSLTVLSGCKSAQPPEPPALGVEVPREWTALSEPETVDLFDGSSWWRQFDDENLDLLVTEALANNRNLLAASARVDAAVAQARIAGADLHPQIGMGVTGSRQSQNFVGFPIPGREQEVLEYMATHLSYPEIAAEIYVSTNTVKSHIRAVFRKLAVSKRKDAVTRAKYYGLIA